MLLVLNVNLPKEWHEGCDGYSLESHLLLHLKVKKIERSLFLLFCCPGAQAEPDMLHVSC